MATFTNPHVLAHPVQHRITLIESAEDVEYFAGVCQRSTEGAGNFAAGVSEPGPAFGYYLIEELNADGVPSGQFKLMNADAFAGRFNEVGDPGLEYGYRAVGAPNVFHHPSSPTINDARRGLRNLQGLHPLGNFEIVSRPTGSRDEWTVAGR
ncbi:hypothetical protein [Arthrobacter sp. UYCo732]|uniref:hypothetical protein n=1 Tax=Arthrobacter sp. UYCo732 TaxID=3156336 RepID=UPI003395A010